MDLWLENLGKVKIIRAFLPNVSLERLDKTMGADQEEIISLCFRSMQDPSAADIEKRFVLSLKKLGILGSLSRTVNKNGLKRLLFLGKYMAKNNYLQEIADPYDRFAVLMKATEKSDRPVRE